MPAPSGTLAVNDFSTEPRKARGDSGLTGEDELAQSLWAAGLKKAGSWRAEGCQVCVEDPGAGSLKKGPVQTAPE